MGKGIASGYMPVEIAICSGCFHRNVCGDKDYLTESKCFDFVDEGRLVVLPCKVGDTVYAHCFGYVDEGVIESFSINQYRLAARFVATDGAEGSFFKEDFGKTVFLTREAAEAALKGAFND